MKSALGHIWWRLLVAWSRLVNSSRILARAPRTYRNWPAFLLDRFRAGTSTLKLRNGLQIHYRTQSPDRATASEVFLLDAYTHATGFHLAHTDIVVDVGANIGCFTVKAASQCRDGRVFAVEPLPQNFTLLQHNIAVNNLPNVTACCMALDAADGTKTLHYGGLCPSLHFSNDTSDHCDVRTLSLRSFFTEHGIGRVDFLKMDCEGAEFDILLSAGAEELGCIRRIIMEYHNLSPEKNHRVLKAHLEKHGFAVEVDEGGWNGELRAWRN